MPRGFVRFPRTQEFGGWELTLASDFSQAYSQYANGPADLYTVWRGINSRYQLLPPVWSAHRRIGFRFRTGHGHLRGESKDAATTKRLDPRPTTPGYDVGSDSLTATATSPAKSKYPRGPDSSPHGHFVLLLVVVSVGVIWSLRAGSRTADAIQINRSLIYPGSRTIVDMSDSGGAVLQLETPDALDKVRAWYEANLKPTKTLRVTSTSVIQKNANVTVTLVSEDKLTSIVIKQVH